MTTTLALSVTINSYQTVEEVPDLDLEIARMACWQFVRLEWTNILIRPLNELLLLLRGFEKRERCTLTSHDNHGNNLPCFLLRDAVDVYVCVF